MGWSNPREDERADYERDLRDDGEPRHRLDRPLATMDAIGVVMLVKCPDVKFFDAVKLVEQYAQTVAAGARLDQVEITGSKILAAIEGGAS